MRITDRGQKAVFESIVTTQASIYLTGKETHG